jgi:glycosyltransferase involved in cell wall biosynthesis
LQINPDANLHFHNYPLSVPSVLKNNIGKTEPVDCLYFARLSKEKGIEDLLKAISIVKKVNSDITVSVIGGANKKYLTYLNSLCSNLNIQENVKFLGFLPTQEDIYKYAFQAKLCVLPTYHDIIPGTIIESMYMKLPVIAYAVGGIPELNLAQETIMLVDKHDISQLAVKIIQLIKDVELRKQLAENAYNYVNKRLDNAKVVNDIINAYKLILNEDSTK